MADADATNPIAPDTTCYWTEAPYRQKTPAYLRGFLADVAEPRHHEVRANAERYTSALVGVEEHEGMRGLFAKCDLALGTVLGFVIGRIIDDTQLEYSDDAGVIWKLPSQWNPASANYLLVAPGTAFEAINDGRDFRDAMTRRLIRNNTCIVKILWRDAMRLILVTTTKVAQGDELFVHNGLDHSHGIYVGIHVMGPAMRLMRQRLAARLGITAGDADADEESGEVVDEEEVRILPAKRPRRRAAREPVDYIEMAGGEEEEDDEEPPAKKPRLSDETDEVRDAEVLEEVEPPAPVPLLRIEYRPAVADGALRPLTETDVRSESLIRRDAGLGLCAPGRYHPSGA